MLCNSCEGFLTTKTPGHEVSRSASMMKLSLSLCGCQVLYDAFWQRKGRGVRKEHISNFIFFLVGLGALESSWFQIHKPTNTKVRKVAHYDRC